MMPPPDPAPRAMEPELPDYLGMAMAVLGKCLHPYTGQQAHLVGQLLSTQIAAAEARGREAGIEARRRLDTYIALWEERRDKPGLGWGQSCGVFVQNLKDVRALLAPGEGVGE